MAHSSLMPDESGSRQRITLHETQDGPRDGRPPEPGQGVTRHASHLQSAIPLGGTALNSDAWDAVSECGAAVAR